MVFKITEKINDGLAEAPSLVVEVRSIDDLITEFYSLDVFTNDYGVPMGVGGTVLIERVL